MYAVFCAPTNFLARAWVMQAVRLAWRAAASLSAAEVFADEVFATVAGTGAWAVAGGTGGAGAGAARDRPPASADRAIKRATAGTERMANLGWIHRE
jgi:hypothetical protein